MSYYHTVLADVNGKAVILLISLCIKGLAAGFIDSKKTVDKEIQITYYKPRCIQYTVER